MTVQGTSKRHALLAAAIVVIGVAVATLVPLTVPGYDTSFTLAWGRDLAHGLSLTFTHPSSPTPHPLAILGGLLVGFLPVPASIHVTLGFTVAVAVAAAVLLGLVAREVSGTLIASLTAVAMVAVSAAVGLLVMNSASDITYLALGLAAVLLTLRHRRVAAIAVFLVAALLRPEAVLLAVVPLTHAIIATRRGPGRGRPESPRAVWTFAVGAVLVSGAWLTMGALGGDPFVGLRSAAANAETNNNPHGFTAAVTSVLPGLAGIAGWLTMAATAVALAVTVVTRRRTAALSAVEDSAQRSILTSGLFVAVGVAAYLAQGLIGTPLVARYLLLPAVLCAAIAARCVVLAARLAHTARAKPIVQVCVATILVAGSVVANTAGWSDVSHAHHVRSEAFTAGALLLDTSLARDCDKPFVVRSPAVVALTALKLGRPLNQIAVAGEAGAGVLLQPLTVDAAELAGYGPMTPLAEQAVFPQESPPRQSNAHWALYSSCQP